MIDTFFALTRYIPRYTDKRKRHANLAVASGALLMSADVMEWLKSVGDDDIEIPWIAEQLTIFGAQNFFVGQIGYRISPENQRSLLADWPHQLICFGQVIGDPLMVSCDMADSSVYAAQHGTGRWEPFKIAPSLASFCEALKIWCDLYFVRFKTGILDSTYAVKPEVIDALQSELSKIFSHEDVRGFMKLLSG